nr:uncharacterized protein LOC129262464 isoform X1 [Lytechinus pictus]
MSRMLGRVSPTFLFEMDSLAMTMAELSLISVPQSPHPANLAKKPVENYLTSVAKMNTTYNSYPLRPSYLATALRYKKLYLWNKLRKKKRREREKNLCQGETDESSYYVDSCDSEPVFGMFDQSTGSSAARKAPISFAMAKSPCTSMSQVNRGHERTTIAQIPLRDGLTPILDHGKLNSLSVTDFQIPKSVPTPKKGRKKQIPESLPVQVSLAKAKVVKKKSPGRPRGRPRKVPIVASEVVDNPPALVFPTLSAPNQTLALQVSDNPFPTVQVPDQQPLPSVQVSGQLPQPKRRGRPPKNFSICQILCQ